MNVIEQMKSTSNPILKLAYFLVHYTLQINYNIEQNKPFNP